MAEEANGRQGKRAACTFAFSFLSVPYLAGAAPPDWHLTGFARLELAAFARQIAGRLPHDSTITRDAHQLGDTTEFQFLREMDATGVDALGTGIVAGRQCFRRFLHDSRADFMSHATTKC